MKRLLILGTCAVLLLVQLFSGVVVNAADTDILIKGYATYDVNSGLLKNSISEGEEIKLGLSVKNNTDKKMVISYIIVDDKTSFYGTDSNTFDCSVNLDKDGSATIPMNLIYRGSGNELRVTFKYSLDGADQPDITQSIFIKNVSKTDNTSSTPVEPAKYPPKLVASKGTSSFAVSAGISNTLTIPVKNTAMYAAKSVSVSLEMEDKTKSTQVLENFNMVQNFDQIASNETKNAVFNLKILSSAPEGVYAFKLNYDFLNFYGGSFNTSETIYIRVVSSHSSPRLTVSSIESTPKVAVPGENVNVKIKINNLGTLTAKDVKVTLKGLKNNGFITNNTSDVKYITKIAGNSSAEVTYALKATAGIPSGSNELMVKIEYSDGSGSERLVEENQIFVPVSRTGSGKGLVIQNIQSPQGSVAANKDFKIAFSLANTGLTDISNIKISLASDKEIVCKSMNSIMVDTLAKGASQKFEFTLFAAQEAITKNYPVAINVEYGEPVGESASKATVSQYVGVFVENGASGKSVPRVIIDKYSYEPEEVKSGDEFTLKMSYLNTSRSTNISNIKVTVSSDDGTFTPVNSSNTFFIDELASKKSIEKVLVLKAKPGVDPKTYALSINFDYEDDKGNQFNTKETISIPVQQPPRLVTGDIFMPTEAFTQQPIPVSIEFYNMGKVTLYNFIVKAEGDFTAQNARYFVGNFESGRSDSFEVQVTPKAAGEMKGNIVFQFEDSAGKAIEVKKEFSVNVMEMPMENPMEGMENMGPDGKPINVNGPKGFNILYIIIPAGVLILAAVLFIVIRKKRIRRRELSLDE